MPPVRMDPAKASNDLKRKWKCVDKKTAEFEVMKEKMDLILEENAFLREQVRYLVSSGYQMELKQAGGNPTGAIDGIVSCGRPDANQNSLSQEIGPLEAPLPSIDTIFHSSSPNQWVPPDVAGPSLLPSKPSATCLPYRTLDHNPQNLTDLQSIYCRPSRCWSSSVEADDQTAYPRTF